MARRRDLTGQVILITGAARGVGLAVATELVSMGATPVLADADEAALTEASEALVGGRSRAYQLDISDADAFRRVLDRVEREHGPIDALVNNAGIMPIHRFEDETDQLAQRQVAVNLLGTIVGTREAHRRMRPRRRGHIVNVASVAGRVGSPGMATYSATKFGVYGYTEAVRVEAKGSGVDFTVVMPGVIDTRLSAGMKMSGVGKASTAEAVADAIVQALQKPRFAVYVPAYHWAVVVLAALLPRAVQDALIKLSGAGHAALDAVDSPSRAEYEREIAAVPRESTPATGRDRGMAVELGSVEFYQELAATLNADDHWAKVSQSLNYSLVFGYGPPIDRDIFLRFDNGHIADVREATAEDLGAADVTVSGPPEAWENIFAKRQSPMSALTRGSLKVKGKLTLLMKNMKAFNYVLEVMGSLEVA